MIRRFHLFPNNKLTIHLLHADLSQWSKLEMDYTITGSCPGSGPDDEGNHWWDNPDRISIVKARRYHNCSLCGKKMGKPKPNVFRRGITPYYYVGIVDNSCHIPEWGYIVKLCLDCAMEHLGEHEVYPCEYYGSDCDLCSWLPKDHKYEIKSEGKLFKEHLTPFMSPTQTSGGT